VAVAAHPELSHPVQVQRALLLSPVVEVEPHTTTAAMVGSQQPLDRTQAECQVARVVQAARQAGLAATAELVAVAVATPEMVLHQMEVALVQQPITPRVVPLTQMEAQVARFLCVALVVTAAGALLVVVWPAMVAAVAAGTPVAPAVNIDMWIFAELVAVGAHLSVLGYWHRRWWPHQELGMVKS